MSELLLDELLRFVLVGARFSKISIDESAMVDDAKQYAVTFTGTNPVVSKHDYAGRPVIELVVGLSATHVDKNDAEHDGVVFGVECTAGFVGAEEALDGNLEEFNKYKEHFGRSIYWMLRERMDSIFAVTMMRTAKTLPWDLPTISQVAVGERSKKRSSPKKKRVAPKKLSS